MLPKNQKEKAGQLYIYNRNPGEVYRVRFVSEEDEGYTYHAGSALQSGASVVNNVVIPDMSISGIKIEVISTSPMKNIIVDGKCYRGNCLFLSSIFKFPQNKLGIINNLPDIFSYKFKGTALIGFKGAVYADDETLIIDTRHMFE